MFIIHTTVRGERLRIEKRGEGIKKGEEKRAVQDKKEVERKRGEGEREMKEK